MKFVDMLLLLLTSGFNFIGDMLGELIKFLAKPLSYIYYFFDGVFYFLYQLFAVIVKVIMIFVALFQFFVAIVAGFMRTLLKMMTINYDATPVNYPSTSMQGIQAVIDEILEPMGVITIVPLILLAMIWFMFAYKIIGLFGGTKNNA